MTDLQSEWSIKQILDRVAPIQNQTHSRKFLKIQKQWDFCEVPYRYDTHISSNDLFSTSFQQTHLGKAIHFPTNKDGGRINNCGNLLLTNRQFPYFSKFLLDVIKNNTLILKLTAVREKAPHLKELLQDGKNSTTKFFLFIAIHPLNRTLLFNTNGSKSWLANSKIC